MPAKNFARYGFMDHTLSFPSGALSRSLRVFFICLLLSALTSHAEPVKTDLSIQKIHEKALRKEPIRVVFFGGSLTWGANASNPQTTSYRGLMMRWLQDQYPGTPFIFHDAAIGGTGSQLGLFRMERDVLSQKPDLVFLDFTVNDGFDDTDLQPLATYERIVRELLARNIMVVPVFMMFKWHAEKPDAPLPARMLAHLKLMEAYNLPYADTLATVWAAVKKGAKPEDLWPFDGAHPGDGGYQLFFEAVRDRFEKGTTESEVVLIPEETVYPDLYPKFTRRVLVDHPLPEGWTREKTYRTSLWFDGMSSRWMGDVACAPATNKPGALEVEFEGSMVGIFGERNGLAPAIKVWVDDVLIKDPKADAGVDTWAMDTSKFSAPKKGSGNLFGWTLLAKDLADGKHILRIEPQWEGANPDAELRIESVCSAGR